MRQSDLCERVVDFLHQCNLEELSDLSVKQLACRFGVTRFHLCRCLKEKRGILVSRYLRGLKFARLAEWLRDQEQVPEGEMGAKIGIYTPRYFSNCFHEYHGAPPKVFLGRSSGSVF